MKLKFFLTIFAVLIIAAISISAIHFHFFRLERLRLIELNLQQNATLILDSDLTLTKKEFSQEGEEYIESIIGDDKVNMIVSIYQENGSLLYQNNNAVIFKTPISIEKNFSEWENVETKDYFIKYLTVKDSAQNRYIRVGMILNQSLLRWKYLSQRVMVYAAIILILISLASFFLTSILLKPIQNLANHINVMTEKLDSGETNDFNSVLYISRNRFNNDEFSFLLQAISRLSAKISESHNITKKWSALMAHELKTPLTILKNRIEGLAGSPGIDLAKITEVEREMSRLEEIIVSFLEWASLESDPARPEIHAISIKKRCEYIIENLKEAFPQRQIEIGFSANDEVRVFCNPIHFDQLISNLITNAIKYGKGKISITCNESSLEIADEGPGIPTEIIQNMGTPFNYLKRNGTSGFGLGLAWVSTICKKYGWSLFIDKSQTNKIKILFPSVA